ncbi:MAG: hypothetical protein WD004_01540 [Actinomycetota bacterium]
MKKMTLFLMTVALAAAACNKTPSTELQTSAGGGSAASAEAISTIRSATQRAAEEGTVKMDFTISMEGMGGFPGSDTGDGAGMSFTGHAEVDEANDLGKFTMEIPFAGQMEMIQDGDVTYMKSAMFSGFLGGDASKPWVKMDMSELGPEYGDVSSLGGGSNNPADMFAALQGVTDDLQDMGTETIDGVETTHYAGTVDLQKAMEQVPESERAELEQSYAGLEAQLGGFTMPFDVWVDGDGLVRRVAFTFDLSNLGGELAATPVPGMQDLKMVMTMDLYDYGVPVDIQIPPADQVSDIGDMGGGFGEMPGEMPGQMPSGAPGLGDYPGAPDGGYVPGG